MSRADIDRFRLRCRQFRWLAIFMVVSVGALLALMHLVLPLIYWLQHRPEGFAPEVLRSMFWILPATFYLFGVWSIGAAMGQLAGGRLIQPTLALALRKVGLALCLGGVLSVFVVTNLMRIIAEGRGGYLHFDVPGMTLSMIGGALFLLGGVVEQAGKVQAELDEMV